ncbi:sigma-70 family RNA polymerase sigma factor [Streptomyces sp. H10-C2]|uniref:sigma-70 family RNA polymerase sigma factor n=1 Tax=unclassified Streptomyces TaxID=2593676 RepID=UPI0024BB1471|nr:MULTISPECIES: sigma-70 family RNA polymerase sigma factor [unclassified Streptomyces]MDJ0345020.1 sigma-70 family RNA polymerase sigma factor [Streptomyces sp. PH10-H1]MDJ0370797.1 sigma-70 family RNA polymerase sigma factor [Streptomyces sp. H10-C2]
MTATLREDELTSLRPLLAAEAAAEAVTGGIEAADLEQAVWLRMLELAFAPDDPARWLRAAVRAEVRDAARRVRRELRYTPGRDPVADRGPSVEEQVLAAEQSAAMRAAVQRLPGRCPQVVTALMSRSDPTYREISQELGISQGSIGPLRSRCLGCLRSILKSGVASPVRRGKPR